VSYRIEFRDGRPGCKDALLYEVDDVPVPQPGQVVVFPSGKRVKVYAAKRPIEHHIKDLGQDRFAARIKVFVR
jgi:hypothetical protein